MTRALDILVIAGLVAVLASCGSAIAARDHTGAVIGAVPYSLIGGVLAAVIGWGIGWALRFGQEASLLAVVLGLFAFAAVYWALFRFMATLAPM
jgi:hypothetical protein